VEDNGVSGLDGPQLLTVRNFRDFGGLPTRDGRTVRSGRLYRSANFGDASVADAKILNDLDIACLLDLRQPHERQAKPNRWPTGKVEVLCGEEEGFANGDLLRETAFFDLIRSGDLTLETARARMRQVYAATVFDPVMLSLYRAWFERIAAADRAVVVHCAAGKDRTGIACALTLHALGVEDDDIIADYERTNAGGYVARRVAEVQDRLFGSTGTIAPPEVLEAFLGADVAYLQHAFAVMAERHGSVTAYLDIELGVGAPLVRRLRERLLV
jgi:protein-tyrosine phosphatase